MRVDQLFHVKYGTNLELVHLDIDQQDGIPFVSRRSGNNGISAKVSKRTDVEPIPAGTISVAAGGSVMDAYLQNMPYYSGRDVYYLHPKRRMTRIILLFYCLCLRKNKYRYSYGRQANKTLSSLDLPDEIPSWVYDSKNVETTELKHRFLDKTITFNFKEWKYFTYSQLFDIVRGRGARKSDVVKSGKTAFISSIDKNNGLSGMVNKKPKHDGNVITVSRNGSVGQAFYQNKPFCSTEDVHIFKPKFELNKFIAIFLVPLIKKEAYRYNYSRKWGLTRMKESTIKLPVDDNGNPDWQFMEDYIKSLPYSKALA